MCGCVLLFFMIECELLMKINYLKVYIDLVICEFCKKIKGIGLSKYDFIIFFLDVIKEIIFVFFVI